MILGAAPLCQSRQLNRRLAFCWGIEGQNDADYDDALRLLLSQADPPAELPICPVEKLSVVEIPMHPFVPSTPSSISSIVQGTLRSPSPPSCGL